MFSYYPYFALVCHFWPFKYVRAVAETPCKRAAISIEDSRDMLRMDMGVPTVVIVPC